MKIKVNGISDYQEVWDAIDRIASERGMNRSDFVMSLVRKHLKRKGYDLPERGQRGRPKS